LTGIVSASERTTIIRVPHEIYKYLIVPIHENPIFHFLKSDQFGKFIEKIIPGSNQIVSSLHKKNLLQLAKLKIIPPNTIITEELENI
jgi:hypothetical protein